VVADDPVWVPSLEIESESELVVLDAALEKVVDTAATVNVLPSKVVV
jgi:hypothetical protein